MKIQVLVTALFCAASTLSATSVRAADGVLNLTWGMTAAEVEKKFPISDKICKLDTKECDSINTELLSKDLITKVHNMQFRITLVFKKGLLQRVVMSPTDGTAAEDIYKQLESENGEPYKTNGAIREWHDGQTIIMFISPPGQIPGLLYANINEMIKP